MTRLLVVINAAGEADHPGPGGLTLAREDAFWVVAYAGERTRMTDSLGLRYLDLLVRQPGRELTAVELVRLAAAGPAGPGPARASADGLHEATGAPADDVLDSRARAAYRQRLTDLDAELAEAQEWNDTERASRIRAEKDFLIRELAAATGLGGRPGSSGRSPSGPGSTSPGRSGPRSPGSASTPRRRRASRPGRPHRNALLLLPTGTPA